MMKRSWIPALCLLVSCSVKKQPNPPVSNDISRVITAMTDIMIHDVTNPPLAARFFSYTCLAGYEAIAQNNPAFKTMHGRLNMYPDLKKPDSISGYNYRLSALLAMMETAKKMQPSGKRLDAYEQAFIDSCKAVGYSTETLDASVKYAQAISKNILAYAKADKYNRISNYPRYAPLNKEWSWYPTPPAYMAAVEPYFNTVRPFTLDSTRQFKQVPPIAFSKDKKSPFFKMLMDNYNEGTNSNMEHRTIAAFWDCNPFAVQDGGHLQMSLKKMSPGAHWLGITGVACEKAHKGFDEAMQIYTAVSIGLMDAFMCCWDEKYSSNRIRPETAVRNYIDPNWMPLLQTPPFPEYLSGHSVISASSATILSHYFGEQFAYRDSVEVSYGLPPRSFTSFKQAAEEAGVSRFYGGIHYMDAVTNGLTQGNKVGEWVINKMLKN